MIQHGSSAQAQTCAAAAVGLGNGCGQHSKRSYFDPWPKPPCS